MFNVLNVTKVKPLLRLSDEERQHLVDFFFSYRYKEPIFRADDVEKKRQLAEQFLATIQKVPVFWYHVEYERGMMRDSLYRWATIVYSDGESIRELQAPRNNISVAITDRCDSYAIIELAESGAIIHSVVFNPHSQW